MTSREPVGTGDGPDEEAFLARWARRKAEARADGAALASALHSPSDGAPSGASTSPETTATETTTQYTAARETTVREGTTDAAPDAGPRATEPTAALPDLDQLDQDSDYSAFLAPGVDAELRRRALRKLFCSPKFNTFDGLDTYRDDFTSFPALGDVVTADMRHHLERLAKRLVEESAPPAVDPPRPTKPSRESAQTASAMAREPVESASPTRPVPGPHEDDESRDTA